MDFGHNSSNNSNKNNEKKVNEKRKNFSDEILLLFFSAFSNLCWPASVLNYKISEFGKNGTTLSTFRQKSLFIVDALSFSNDSIDKKSLHLFQ